MASVHPALPDSDTLAKAASALVFDADGKEHSFGSLIQDKKTIVVFIRHFFCGQYVAQLASVRKDAFDQADARLVIIGCGEWKLIKHYSETTDFKGDMYADPSRTLYHALGLVESYERTPAGQEKRSYLSKSFVGNLVRSLWDGPLKNPQFIGKQGNFAQLGGDFIFGPGQICTYASRMQHTEDHIEVDDLMKEAGVTYP